MGISACPATLCQPHGRQKSAEKFYTKPISLAPRMPLPRMAIGGFRPPIPLGAWLIDNVMRRARSSPSHRFLTLGKAAGPSRAIYGVRLLQQQVRRASICSRQSGSPAYPLRRVNLMSFPGQFPLPSGDPSARASRRAGRSGAAGSSTCAPGSGRRSRGG